jgi:hypothetical protein
VSVTILDKTPVRWNGEYSSSKGMGLWTLAVVVLMGRPKLELVGCFADQ